LKYLLEQKLATIPQHQWASKVLGFDFRVEFKTGSSNVVANALLHRDVEASAELAALSAPSFHLFDTLQRKIDDTPELRSPRDEVQAGHRGDKWRVVDGLITMSGRVYLPLDSTLMAAVLQHAHDVGHEGVERTLHRLRIDFHLPDALTIVWDHVRACMACQRNKSEHLHLAGLLQPLDVPSVVWADVAMDFVEGFPRISGKSIILTVVNMFSKVAHFIPIGHPYTVTSVARVFFNMIMRLHGIPSSIVSGRDPVFTSRFWRELFELTGI
jgi:hypothetical protein